MFLSKISWMIDYLQIFSRWRRWGLRRKYVLRISMCVVKGDWNGAVFGITVKRLALCRCLDGHVKEPYEMSLAWEPDRKSIFFSPPEHLRVQIYVPSHTSLKYRWLWRTLNLVNIFLYIYAPMISDEYHARFHLNVASPAERNTEQVNIYKKSCPR